jgi:transposase-like protein
MHTPEIQMPQAGRRRRGRYSDEFKRRVIAACLEPGVSTASVANNHRSMLMRYHF